MAGFITTPDQIPTQSALFHPTGNRDASPVAGHEKVRIAKPTVVEGTVWIIPKDDIDTDMIFHNRYLTITDIGEMGQYTFDNLKGSRILQRTPNQATS